MATFQPSAVSARQNTGISAAAASLIGAGISAAGGLASAGIGTSSSRKAQERQIKHEQEMADKHAQLALLQAQTDDGSDAQAAATQALEAIRSKRMMVLAGFGLAGLAIIGLTVVMATRSGSSEDDYYEDEEYA